MTQMSITRAGLFAAVVVLFASFGSSQTLPPAGAESGNPAAHQGAVQAAKGARVNPRDGLKYVWIPPGTFQMGCSPGDDACGDDEKPPHRVIISKGFWMGQTPATVRAYKRLVAATGKRPASLPPFESGWATDDMPIVYLTWDEANDFCGWAGGRLPTEAEWEYAARAGSLGARYGPLEEIAWYGKNSGERMHEVAQKRPNRFGLFDMLGNVNQYVNDWYDPNYYRDSPAEDPQGPLNGQERVLRGVSWALPFSRPIRVSLRGSSPLSQWGYGTGFRCAISSEWHTLRN
jgi:formylglycine-generating enzyme required for sulfatase activity